MVSDKLGKLSKCLAPVWLNSKIPCYYFTDNSSKQMKNLAKCSRHLLRYPLMIAYFQLEKQQPYSCYRKTSMSHLTVCFVLETNNHIQVQIHPWHQHHCHLQLLWCRLKCILEICVSSSLMLTGNWDVSFSSPNLIQKTESMLSLAVINLLKLLTM